MKRHYERLKLKVKFTPNADVLTVSLGAEASPSAADGYFASDWADSTSGADE